MAEQQLAQQQIHTHATSWRVEMMAIARHQPLTAWPPNQARKRPVKAAYTSAMMLQMLARNSTHANNAPHTPASAPAASASFVSPFSSSTAAAPAPAAPKPAQQQAKIQLRTMMPPSNPHTTGSAVCGALLPTPGTLTGGATAGSGASGTRGRVPATLEAAPVVPLETVLAAPPAAPSTSGCKRPNASGAQVTLRTIAQRINMTDISLHAGH